MTLDHESIEAIAIRVAELLQPSPVKQKWVGSSVARKMIGGRNGEKCSLSMLHKLKANGQIICSSTGKKGSLVSYSVKSITDYLDRNAKKNLNLKVT